MSAPTPLMRVENLSFAYRHRESWVTVLDGVSFAIERGETFGLVGESGCGKSTIAYTLLGYRPPQARVLGGRVLFAGSDMLALERAELDRLRGNRMSLIPQNPTTALSPHMRVERQIGETLLEHAAVATPRRALERTIELLRLVGLPAPERIGRRYPHELSGGQQQRVCIAMALACEPDLVVLDEPTTGLDVTTQEQVIRLLLDLRERVGMAMLYVTHDLGLLGEIADRVGVMYAGHMVEVASTRVIYAEPRHPYTRGLIASIPRIDDSPGTRGRPLRGLLRREELPPGCAFQPRCDFAHESCAANRQVLEAIDSDHEVACERWRELPAERASAAPGAEPRAPRGPVVPVLDLEGVSLGYGRDRGWFGLMLGDASDAVVSEVSLTIARRECFALVGESGSGKSTIARAVSGLLAPIEGRLSFEGAPMPGSVRDRSPELRRRIQYIFQNPDASLNPRARVGSIVARPLQVFLGLDGAERRARVARALADVRLDAGYAARYPDQLSGGERQRVAIARALVADPVLLLCDEILSALDVSVAASILELLERLRVETEVAMLFISHDLAVVRALADRVGVLFRGRLCEIGSVDSIFSPPFHPYTHSLLLAVPGVRPTRRTAERVESIDSHGRGGCAYAGRCPWQLGELCERVPPPWRETSEGLAIRCHIPLAELAERSGADRAEPLPT